MMSAKMFLYTSPSPLARTFHLKVAPGQVDLLWPLILPLRPPRLFYSAPFEVALTCCWVVYFGGGISYEVMYAIQTHCKVRITNYESKSTVGNVLVNAQLAIIFVQCRGVDKTRRKSSRF